MRPVINSLLDTDLYKLSMMQCVLHHFKNTNVCYHLIFRKPLNLSSIVQKLRAQIDYFCSLRFETSDLDYLSQFHFFKPDFIDFLSHFRFNAQDVQLSCTDTFDLKIQGSWLATILYEVPLLAMISECYYEHHYPHYDLTIAQQKLTEKIAYLQQHAPLLHFSDFGSRRRFSKHWHEQVILSLTQNLPLQFDGTSNIQFAKLFKLNPIGTMAHEYLQAAQVLSPTLEKSQTFALNAWLSEYPNDLGIALTDTISMDAFLQEFNQDLATKFAGLRQDSGDPIVWGEKALAHYKKLGIDASKKRFVFSDSLNFERAIAIYRHFHQQCHLSFGIGTYLTNDVGLPPLDIVIKMTHTNGQPVIKVSDSPGKTIYEDPIILNKIVNAYQLTQPQ